MVENVTESLEKIEKRNDFHWVNVEVSETSPGLVTALILQKRGYPITLIERPQAPLRQHRLRLVEELGESWGRHVAIYCHMEGARALHKIDKTLERYALGSAANGLGDEPPDVSGCQWDDETKTRVVAFFWQNRARYFQEIAEYATKKYGRGNPVELETKANDCRARAEGILDGLVPITSGDIRLLLEEVVDRELAYQ